MVARMARTIRLSSAFERAVAERQRHSTTPLWQEIGVHRTTLHRVRTGETEPSTAFIAGALRAFAPMRFEDLFESVEQAEQ